jgi:peptidoglycan/xylan/chitin deacetylase (PgdA/CDA1 family)
MKFVRPPFFIRWMSPRWLWCKIPVAEKVIFITFDDGPIPEATPEVLDILGSYNALATFFMVGENVVRNPEILQRVKQEGHAIGNHTFHHLNGWHTSPGAYLHDVRRCNEHVDSNLFRPPYARFTPSQYLLLRNDFRFVLWSVLTYDFHRGTTPEQCLDISISNSGSGSVVVFHDNIKAIRNLRYALPRFIDHFMQEGYQFRAIEPYNAPSSAKL